MDKKIKKIFVIILVVAMFFITIFTVNIAASTSGDEHRTSNSERLGDDNGESQIEPGRNRSEDRSRMEDY